jgi:hypothetical protein
VSACLRAPGLVVCWRVSEWYGLGRGAISSGTGLQYWVATSATFRSTGSGFEHEGLACDIAEVT